MRQALKRLVPGFNADPIAAIDKKNPVYRLNSSVIESDVHRFLKLVQEAKSLSPESAGAGLLTREWIAPPAPGPR